MAIAFGRYRRVYVLLAWSLIVASFAGAISKLEAKPTPKTLASEIGPGLLLANLEFYYDESNALGAVDLMSSEHNYFEPLLGNLASTYNSGSLWLRFSLANDLNRSQEIILYWLPSHYCVETFQVGSDGQPISLGDVGTQVPLEQRQVYSRYPALPVNLGAGSLTTYLVRLRTTDVLRPQISAAPAREFYRYDYAKSCFVALYYGLMIALIFYNLFLYITIRDLSYLYYIMFAASYSLLLGSLDGFDDFYLGQGLVGTWARLDPHLDILAILFVNLFVGSLLDLPRKEPKLNRLRNVFTVVLVTLLLLQMGTNLTLLPLVDGITLIIAWAYLMVGVKQWVQGSSKVAKYFTIAWSSLILAASAAVILPHYSGLSQETIYAGLYIGSALEVVLMSFALGSRITLLEHERFEAIVKAQEADKLQSLVRVLCHDISTPLAIVTSCAELALDSRQAPTPGLGRWQKVERAVRVIKEILDNVKYIEAIRSGKLQLSLQAVSLREALTHANFLFEKELRAKNISISYRVLEENTDDVFILSERVSFYNQVVGNIISNAIKFSYPGQAIDVCAKHFEDWWIIEFRDYGQGMEESHMEAIFSYHKKTSSTGTAGEKGTGFGMPLVKLFVEMCGGRIVIESRPKKDGAPGEHGTAVRLYLKKAAPPESLAVSLKQASP